MSVSVADMARQDSTQAQSPTSSKKRKHTDEELAEKKQKKKSKHGPAMTEEVETLATTDKATIPKEKKKRKIAADEEASTPVVVQNDLADIELPDLEGTAEAPVAEPETATPFVLKKISKKRRKSQAQEEPQEESPDPTPAEQDAQSDIDIELPDAEDDIFATPPPLINGAKQPTPPSESTENSPFQSTRTSLYVPCPAISLTTALPSLISTHLTPLLLTYYAPLNGIVLSISNITISSSAASSAGKPLTLPSHPSSSTQLALCADDHGVSFIWLSATFTTFHPQPNSTFSGPINVASEGFIGLVLYNYFQVGIPRARIPKSWQWTAPGGTAKSCRKQPKKGRIRDASSEDTEPVIPDSQTTASNQETLSHAQTSMSTGHWTRSDGSTVKDSNLLTFRVVDCDIVPSNARGSERMTLQIEGTLLSEEEEGKLLGEERMKFERAQNKAHGRTNSPGSGDQTNMMSGGIGLQKREGSVSASLLKHRVAY